MLALASWLPADMSEDAFLTSCALVGIEPFANFFASQGVHGPDSGGLCREVVIGNV